MNRWAQKSSYLLEDFMKNDRLVDEITKKKAEGQHLFQTKKKKRDEAKQSYYSFSQELAEHLHNQPKEK